MMLVFMISYVLSLLHFSYRPLMETQITVAIAEYHHEFLRPGNHCILVFP